jgi:CRISPR type I-D-associated protein Csc3/Cas10d
MSYLTQSISDSAYRVTKQMESAVLFTPQLYTNKQMLNGSNAKGNISSIAILEMMLRQILMNQTQAVGKRFEDAKYCYLYFYPTYYCTPETNKFLQSAMPTLLKLGLMAVFAIILSMTTCRLILGVIVTKVLIHS